MPKLEQVLKGVKSSQAKEEKVKARLPVTPEILLQMKKAWGKESGSRDVVMLWAAASLCSFGFLCSREICVPSDHSYDEGAHLSFHDISVDSTEAPSSLKVRIKESKTDPIRLGVDIFGQDR